MSGSGMSRSVLPTHPRDASGIPSSDALMPQPGTLRLAMPKSPADQPALFAEGDVTRQPLAARVRPQTLDLVLGQRAILGPGQPLRRAVESGRTGPLVLWGPPGSGKT